LAIIGGNIGNLGDLQNVNIDKILLTFTHTIC